MKIRAKYPTGSPEYYQEGYSLQHFTDRLGQLFIDVPSYIWFAIRHMTSKKFRMEVARAHNRALFGNIPTNQIYVMPSDGGPVRPMRPEERTWPE